ncbi:MAG: 1-aminocyclopropane-1-carboxylate deaminase/D-cysteine desulfhydrase [Pontibacterium sp.]
MSYSLCAEPVRLERLVLPLFKAKALSVYLLRLDQIHPQVSGNKWFKLYHNLKYASEQGYERVLSFGGAYSNHLHALAWAGNQMGIETVAVVRGEPEYAANPTLTDAKNWGMQLHFVNRKTYRQRENPDFIHTLLEKYPGAYIVPEGGSNALAVKGFEGIFRLPCWQDLPRPDFVVSACGTGGTLAGLIAAKPEAVKILGIPVLKGAEFLYRDIRTLLTEAGVVDPGGWQLDLQGHEGGYGRRTQALNAFMDSFQTATAIELDPVYTAKVMFRLTSLIEQGKFSPGASIVAIHTGGLQGCRGFL